MKIVHVDAIMMNQIVNVQNNIFDSRNTIFFKFCNNYVKKTKNIVKIKTIFIFFGTITIEVV